MVNLAPRNFLYWDLLLIAALGIWLVGVANELIPEFPGQMIIGFTALLFAPGYGVVAALYPDSDATGPFSGTIASQLTDRASHVSPLERVVLALGASISLLAIVGIGMHYTPFGVQSGPIAATLGSVTIGAVFVASYRRGVIPQAGRFNPTVGGACRSVYRVLGTSQASIPLTMLLIASVVIGGGGIGYAVFTAEHGEPFTEFYIVTEDPETGAAVAGNYPTEVAVNQTIDVNFGISNHEGEPINYTAVTLLQSETADGDFQTLQRMDEYTVSLSDNESIETERELNPEITGESLRVTSILFLGTPPDTDDIRPDEGYRTVHFWIDVEPAESE